jgi:hypothetical protein
LASFCSQSSAARAAGGVKTPGETDIINIKYPVDWAHKREGQMLVDQTVILRQLDETSRHLNLLRGRAHERAGSARDFMLSEIAEVEESIAQLKAAVDRFHPALPGPRPTR